MSQGDRYADLDTAVWRQLLAQGALLSAAAEHLDELHLRSQVPGLVRSAVSYLPIVGQQVRNAGSDEDAILKASRLWSDYIDSALPSSSGADAPLRGYTDEQTLLARVRECVRNPRTEDPFEKYFKSISTLASEVYGTCWLEPRLNLAWRKLHPRGGPIPSDPYALTASVGAAATPQVELAIQPDGLGPAAFAAIPYLLIHECVCHVPARQAGQVSNDSPFAEGFMDYVAHLLFARWIESIDNRLVAAARQHTFLFDSILAHPSTTSGAARFYGQKAGERVVSWARDHLSLSTLEAENRLIAFATSLNCFDTLLAVKDSFVVSLREQDWSLSFQDQLAGVLRGIAAASTILPP